MTESGVRKRLAMVELLKHLATVSIAAIAVVAAMIPESGSDQSGAYKIALTGFLLSLVGAMYACFAVMANLESYPSWIGTTSHRIYQLVFVVMVFGLCLGVVGVAYSAFGRLA